MPKKTDPAPDAKARKEAARAVKKAFKHLGLDIRQPADWERLHAIVLETQKPKRGAPPKWLWDGLLALGFAYETVYRQRRPKTLARAAALIRERYPAFKSIAGDDRALARRLPMAIQLYKSFRDKPRDPRLGQPQGIEAGLGKYGEVFVDLREARADNQ